MKSARLFVVFLLVVVSGAGCAVNIKTNVHAQGEKLSVPVGGVAIIRGDVVDITIATERDFYFLQKGARHDANPNLDRNIENYEKKIILIEMKDCSVCAHASFCCSNPPDESGVNHRSLCVENAKANFFPEEDKKLFGRRG